MSRYLIDRHQAANNVEILGGARVNPFTAAMSSRRSRSSAAIRATPTERHRVFAMIGASPGPRDLVDSSV